MVDPVHTYNIRLTNKETAFLKILLRDTIKAADLNIAPLLGKNRDLAETMLYKIEVDTDK